MLNRLTLILFWDIWRSRWFAFVRAL